MIPSGLIAEHRRTMEDIETLALRDLVSVWRTTDPADPQATAAAVRPAAHDLTAAYGEVAAVAGADYYEEVRAQAGPPGRFRAVAAPPAPADQVDSMVGWALTPLFTEDAPQLSTILSRLAGATQRLIRQPERDSIFGSGRRDKRLASWVRTPSGSACEFCLMLASRTDLYQTRESASVVGTGRIRGTRVAGESFHDNCRCTTTPVWSDDDVPELNRQLADEWERVAGGEHDQLKAWRKHIAETRPHQHVKRP